MLDEIREIICNCVPVESEDITEDSRFLADLGMSSLDLVMVAVEAEKTYGVTIPDKLYASVKTVGDLMKYIEENK